MRNKIYDVTAVGDILIDFLNLNGMEFIGNPGGAPANVLASVNKLGGESSFIGKAGEDIFGKYLKNVLVECGINVENFILDEKYNTTLAFVSLDEDGDRSFSFYRKEGADTMIRADEIDFEVVKNSKIFHFGSLSLTNSPARETTYSLLEYAKKNNIMISFDPNLRASLWNDLNFAREQMLIGLQYANVLKIAVEELEFITKENDLQKALEALPNNIELVAITKGKAGAMYNYSKGQESFYTYDTKVIDTTGSGDAFTGALLYKLANINKNLSEIEKDEMKEIFEFANAAGALCATGKGAINSMPDQKEIIECIRDIPLLIV